MKLLPIVTIHDNNPVLHSRAHEVENIGDPAIQELITDMIPTMYKKDGVGLAATQVGKGVRIAVIIPDPNNFDRYKDDANQALVLINPTVINHSFFKESSEEGCLSVPDVFGNVRRWKKITITYFDRHGDKHTLRATGLRARVIQHEIDHLDGILFIEKADKLFKIEPLENDNAKDIIDE